MPDLVLKDVVVEYTTGSDYKIRPVDNMSLTINAGSLAILLGPSGCGKTTLLSCLGAILTPTSGSIRFGDIEVAGLGGAALTDYRRHHVGIVFQAFNLVPSLSALDNVAVPMRADGWSRKKARERALELLGMVDLTDRVHHRPGDLSGGQQQRVAVARALALDPPLIVADEPTAHLDYVQVESVLRIIAGLTDGERVVVVATHDERLLSLADQVVELVPHSVAPPSAPVRIVLADGQVLFRQGDRSDLIYEVDEGEVDLFRVDHDGTENHV